MFKFYKIFVFFLQRIYYVASFVKFTLNDNLIKMLLKQQITLVVWSMNGSMNHAVFSLFSFSYFFPLSIVILNMFLAIFIWLLPLKTSVGEYKLNLLLKMEFAWEFMLNILACKKYPLLKDWERLTLIMKREIGHFFCVAFFNSTFHMH